MSLSSKLADKLKQNNVTNQTRTAPLWKGPESNDPQGGVTFSLFSRFLVCPERFRVHTIEGLKPVEKFNHKMEYGNMFHLCEETFLKHSKSVSVYHAVDAKLHEYCKGLTLKFPTASEEIDKWFNVCRTQFPIYVDYWSKHPEMIEKENLLQEYIFNVPYPLPSGRTVYLKGKFDSVDRVKEQFAQGIWIQENKIKGDVKPFLLQRQLKFDLQTLIYVIALENLDWTKVFDVMDNKSRVSIWKAQPNLTGVRYNVIRRPLSGGVGTIVQHKATQGSKCTKCFGRTGIVESNCPKCGGIGRTGGKPEETKESYFGRLAEYIKGVDPQDEFQFFYRWNVAISQRDIDNFKTKCLNPLLELLCCWYDEKANVQAMRKNIKPETLHYQRPFGVYNILDEGGATDLDEYLLNGSKVGLVQNDDLFPELKG